MLEAAGGGGGGTDWWGMSMETIQQLAQSPDIDAHYQIIDGWQKSADLVGEHMSQVQQYRDALATAWPPEKSSAAAAYITRLDALIKNLNETYEASLSNHEALSSASLSLSLAKTEMNKLYSQWDSNNKALLAYNQQQAQKKSQAASGQPTPSPSPSGEEPPPATASQQEALRQKAITLMSGVSSDLAQAQLKVVRPAQYQPADFVGKTEPAGGSGTSSPPILPPIVPAPYSGGDGSRASTRTSARFPTTPNHAPTVGTTIPDSSAANPGLVLGGTNPPTLQPPTITPNPNPINALPSNGGSITSPGVLPGTTGPFVPNETLAPPFGKVPANEGGGFRPFGGAPEVGPKALPPGGIIGRTPGGTGLSEPSANRFGPQRVNPVGGVIGEPSAGPSMMAGGQGIRGGSTATNRSGLNGTASQSYGQAGSRQAGQRSQSDDMSWDPDNPWATDEGVTPVVLPPTEQQIDPGPAIGLD